MERSGPADRAYVPSIPSETNLNDDQRPQFVCTKHRYAESDLPFTPDPLDLDACQKRIKVEYADPCQPGHPRALIMDNVFSTDECKSIIAASESLGFTFWDTTGQADVKYRSAYTVEVEHKKIADTIFERIRPWLEDLEIENDDDPKYSRDFCGRWCPDRGFSHLLIGRYRQGGHFSPHTDGTNYVDVNRRTAFTTLLYLKDTESGGRTFLLKPESKSNPFGKNERGHLVSLEDHRVHAVIPKAGRLLVFYHEDMHEGEGVSDGHEKYIIRTDVVYRRTPEILNSDNDKEAFRLWVESQRVAEEDDDPQTSLRLLRKALALSPGLSEILGMG